MITRRIRLSYANVVASLALFAALGGVGYAAGVLPKNSVGTAQLQKNAVTGAKLKKNAVTGAKVKDGTLLAADLKAGELPAGPQGPKGDPGPQGAKGDPGEAGPPGPTASRSVGRSPTIGALNGIVIDLLSANSTASDQRITTSFSGRINAVATVQVRNLDATAGQGECAIYIDGTQSSQNYLFDLPAATNHDVVVTVVGSVVKPPGTYNVALQCFESAPATNNFQASRANLAVWAAAS